MVPTRHQMRRLSQFNVQWQLNSTMCAGREKRDVIHIDLAAPSKHGPLFCIGGCQCELVRSAFTVHLPVKIAVRKVSSRFVLISSCFPRVHASLACSDLSLKVILVGESGCGKSSILQRFTRDLFSEQTQSTIAVDFQIKNAVFASKKVAVQVWDTGGSSLSFSPFTSSSI